MPSSSTHAIIPLHLNKTLNAALYQRNVNLISLQGVATPCKLTHSLLTVCVFEGVGAEEEGGMQVLIVSEQASHLF